MVMNEARLFASVLGDQPPAEFRIFPRGRFTATQFFNGKPVRREYLYDRAAADSVMAMYRERGNPRIVIDYEHASMAPAGEIAEGAPAAGWFSLEDRPDGLYAVDVKWTPKAYQRLKDHEYGAFSPVFGFDKEGRVLYLRNLALTNDPATDHLEFLMAARAVPFHSYPVVEGPWDANAAITQARQHAGIQSSEDLKDPEKRAKYALFFALVDGDGLKLGDYFLPHHRVQGGKIVTSKKGVEAAAAALQGARGARLDKKFPAAELTQAKHHLASEYHLWGGTAPWETQHSTHAPAAVRAASENHMYARAELPELPAMPDLPELPEDAPAHLKAHQKLLVAHCKAMHQALSAHHGAMEAHCKAMGDHGEALEKHAEKVDAHHELMEKALPAMEKLSASPGSLPSASDVPPGTPRPAPAAEGEALARAEKITSQITALTGKTDVDEAIGTLHGLKASAEQVAALSAKITALETEKLEREVTELVDGAIKERKAMPVERESLIGMGKSNLAILRSNIAARQPLPGGSAQPPASGGEGQKFSDETIAMAKKAGVSPDTLTKFGQA